MDRLGALTALSFEAREVHDSSRVKRLMQPIHDTYCDALSEPGMRRARAAVKQFLNENCLTVSVCIVQLDRSALRGTQDGDDILLTETELDRSKLTNVLVVVGVIDFHF